jgi:hypothetical protein
VGNGIDTGLAPPNNESDNHLLEQVSSQNEFGRGRSTNERFGLREVTMRFSVIGLAITMAILWGGSILLVGLINLAAPSFGAGYLGTMSSFHPGFQASRVWSDVFVGTLAGIVDGAVAGLLFAWLYNWFAGMFVIEAKPKAAPSPTL